MILRAFGALSLCSVFLAGCSADKKANAAQPAAVKEGSVPPRATVISMQTQPYRAVQVTGGGRLTGTVDFEGALPADSTIQLPSDQAGCGQTIKVHNVDNSGTKIGGAVVWLTDIRTGKFFPLQKRFELVNEDCRLSPHVQAVVATGTLNVASEDVAMHRDRIINVGTGVVEAIAPFNDNGEVVPFDRLLDKPAQLEVICDLHPWSKAHILVVDHPYFTTTEKSGSFSIDDIPPGTYHVKAWHPELGVAEQVVTIVAGQPASIALKLVPIPAASPTATNSQSKGGT
ncbi:MAG: carboxypeptidase regulatory-like domain-containing protein [Gemmatimonadales bacterium]